MTRYAIPGPVNNEITIMVQVGTTTAGEDKEPSADPQGFTDDTLASAARTAAMISTWLTITVEMRSSFRAVLQEVDTRRLLLLKIPSHHRLQKSFRRGWAILFIDELSEIEMLKREKDSEVKISDWNEIF
jgi:hypothetical protein